MRHDAWLFQRSGVGQRRPQLEVRLRAVWMSPPPLRFQADLGSRYEFRL